MKTKQLQSKSKPERNARSFERVLHRWGPWLDAVQSGKNTLSSAKPGPSLEEMKSTAKKALLRLGFTPCTLLEVYWLCCVLVDYQVQGRFRFEELVLPEWFPSDYGFESRVYDFGQKRIYPPEVWDEADWKFWFERDPFVQVISPKSREEFYPKYPDIRGALVMPIDHPVRKFMRRGRPIGSNKDGTTYVD